LFLPRHLGNDYARGKHRCHQGAFDPDSNLAAAGAADRLKSRHRTIALHLCIIASSISGTLDTAALSELTRI
jgi:hypothetical protein